VARVGERRHRGSGPDRPGISVRTLGSGRPPSTLTDVVVADLSALWAGPLVGALLVAAGARVAKVESVSRPDGARHGQPEHFASLNDGKESVLVEWGTPAGRAEVARIVDGSDVVVTSARPRALEQAGLDPVTVVRDGRPRVWLSVTGYGGGPGSAGRVAFGDDAAAAGGLVVWDDRGPCFCADAVADPLTGLAAAAAVFDALARGGDHVIDASMADVAGGLAGADDTAAAG
jgi:crotonobetainyl-CoA:carnitine CoA-transferase CaiB-like acyl-CoA transferase